MKVKPPTYTVKPPIVWSYIFVSASFALLIGFALLLGWVKVMWTAPILWLVLTALWVFLVNLRELKRAFLHVFLIAAIGGAFAGLLPMLFHEAYLENNPDVKRDLGATVSTFDKLQVLYMNVGYGLAFGALGGFVAEARSKRQQASAPTTS